jgi:hypothetical protein
MLTDDDRRQLRFPWSEMVLRVLARGADQWNRVEEDQHGRPLAAASTGGYSNVDGNDDGRERH